MLAGDLYIADDPENERRAARAVQLADRYHRAFVTGDGAARSLLSDLIGNLGEDAMIKPPLFVDYGEHITVGARTFVNYNLTALDVAPIAIGEDCRIGRPSNCSPRRIPSTRSHDATSWKRPGPSRSATTSGSAAASSSAPGDDRRQRGHRRGVRRTRDIPANVVAVSNPARVVRSI